MSPRNVKDAKLAKGGYGRATTFVHLYLDADPAMRAQLAKGLISLRATARSLIETEGWRGVSEDAIVSALRRYPVAKAIASAQTARDVIEAGRLHVRANLAMISVPKTRDGLRKIADVAESVASTGSFVRVFEGENTINVVMDEREAANARESVAGGKLTVTPELVVEYTVSLPAGAGEVPGLLGIVFSTLGANGINVIGVVCGKEDQIVFVRKPDANKAFRALSTLIRGRGRTDRSLRGASGSTSGR